MCNCINTVKDWFIGVFIIQSGETPEHEALSQLPAKLPQVSSLVNREVL